MVDFGKFANHAHRDWLQWVEGGIRFALFFWCVHPAVRSVWGLGTFSVFLHATVAYPFSRSTLGSCPILLPPLLAVGEQRYTHGHIRKMPSRKLENSQ